SGDNIVHAHAVQTATGTALRDRALDILHKIHTSLVLNSRVLLDFTGSRHLVTLQNNTKTHPRGRFPGRGYIRSALQGGAQPMNDTIWQGLAGSEVRISARPVASAPIPGTSAVCRHPSHYGFRPAHP